MCIADMMRAREDVLRMQLDSALSKVEELKTENAKLRKLVRDYDKCLDTALYLAGKAGYPNMPDGQLFESLRPRMRELGIEGGK